MRSLRAAGSSAAVVWTCVTSVAHAEPVTVWLTDDLPEERVREKADLQTGGTLHLSQDDLRWAPTPATPADDAAIAGVEAAWDRGRERWDEFDVELSIATELQNAVDAITLLRTDDEREDLARALLFQGTAAARAFDPTTFATDPIAAPLRFDAGGVVAPLPWVRAYALTGEKAQRGDLVDGTGWLDWQRYGTAIGSLPLAHLTVPEGIGEVSIDGRPVAAGTIDLRAGRHWIHVLRAGAIAGRTVLDVGPGQTYAMPTPIDADELGTTRARVLEGKRAGFPADVLEALHRIEVQYGGPIYVGAVDRNKPVLVPLGNAATLKDDRLVTLTLFADVGGGVIGTPMFDQKPNHESLVALDGTSGTSSGLVYGDTRDVMQVAGAAFAGLGAELGVSYFAAALGVDAAFTPGRSIDYVIESPGEPDADSGHADVFPQPWIGLGAYVLRPTKPAPTLSILGTVSYMAPTHLAYGGRVTFGIPIDDKPTWIRFTAGGNYGPDTLRDVPGAPSLFSGWLRLGFGVRP